MIGIMYRKPVMLSEQGVYLRERLDDLTRVNIPEAMKKQVMKFSECLSRTAYKYSNSVVPCCQGHTRFEIAMGVHPDKIQVVDNGIELDRFRPGPPRGDGPVVVGCFARVVPIKNIKLLIKSAEIILKKATAEFVVVGSTDQDPTYYKQCQELVQQVGIGDHFKFIGFANPLEWYHRVDIFVLSSLSEGVPYALLEAMACRLACVGTAVGGIPEILSDPSIGFVVPPEEPEPLAEALLRLIQDRDLRLRMAQTAYDVAQKKYSLKHETDDIRQIYNRLVHGEHKVSEVAEKGMETDGKAVTGVSVLKANVESDNRRWSPRLGGVTPW